MTTVQSKDGPEIRFEASGAGLALTSRGLGGEEPSRVYRQSWEASFDNRERVLAA
jgi:hypothetical protein